MSAKLLYTKAGSDPTTGLFPAAGPPHDRFMLTSGTPLVTNMLIAYPDHIEFADGRLFPSITPQGSTVVHVKG
jgi:hypothetical protein